MQLSTILEIATAVGTVGATVTAVAFGVVAERRSRADRRRAGQTEKERRASEHRHQAQRISLWGDEGVERDDDGHWSPRYTLTAHNSSDQPVFGVTVPLVDIDPRIGEEVEYTWDIGTLVPGEKRTTELSHNAWYLSPRFEVQFRDNAGHLWRRNVGGTLTEVTADEPES